nr:DUF3857 domain-containing protein [uncultured Carboxylicivirga sp.]
MKHRYKYMLIVFLLTPLSLFAKEKNKYPVSEIPQELISDAHAVVRKESLTYQYISPSEAIETNYYAITILKESALDMSEFSTTYDKLSKVSDIVGTIYDKDGKRVKRIKQEDIEDYSAISGATLYADNRVKYIDPKYNSYPFTIEYSYSRKYKTTMFTPRWSVFSGFNVPVQESELVIISPTANKLHYTTSNMPVDPEITEADGVSNYVWSIKNYLPPKEENNRPPFYEWAPMVFTSPSSFEIEGYSGSYNSWEQFGNFTSKLLEGKNNVPQSTLDKVKSLLTDDMSDYEKIQTIYNFAQKKNRYISVQVGIGGWQPFSAEVVDENSYGDCKALSNYTMSLLKDNGFKCHYTLVNAGSSNVPLDPDFPDSRFNHACLCVPLANDTIWLECTNPYAACGYIGDFTDDRKVLIIDGEHSKLVNTPAYTADENAQILNGKITIEETGDAKGQFTFSYTGAKFSDYDYLTRLDDSDKKKRITKSISLPNFSLVSFDLKEDKARHPQLDKILDIDMPQYATKMGSRLLIKLNSINSQTYIPPYARKREMPLFFRRNMSEKDTVIIEIPSNFMVEALPDAYEIDKEFASFKCSTKVVDNTIEYYREFVIHKGEYPREDYNEFRDFLESVAKADASNVIIKPKS